MKVARLSAFLLGAILCAAGPTRAQTPFYAGKVIKMTVGGSAGGGYDTQARTLATYLQKEIDGQPSIIVQNLPAGAGIAAVNHLAEVAKRDGTEMGALARDALFAGFVKNELARFSADKLNWIGSTASYADNAHVVFVRAALPVRTIDDLKKAPQTIVFGGKGSIFVPLTREVLRGNLRLIDSYQNSDLNLAIERGEIDGTSTGYLNIQRETPDWLSNRKINILVQFGHAQRLPSLPDVPTAQELIANADDKALVKFAEFSLTLGFPFAAPPGAPPEAVDALRRGFDATMKNPEYVATLKKMNLEYSPIGGEALSREITEASNASPDIIRRFNALTKKPD